MTSALCGRRRHTKPGCYTQVSTHFVINCGRKRRLQVVLTFLTFKFCLSLKYLVRVSEEEGGQQLSEETLYDQQRCASSFGQTRQRVSHSGGKYKMILMFSLWFFCTGHVREVCVLVSVGLLPFLRYPCIPEHCDQKPIPKSLLFLCCGPSSPVGVFDYFFKWIWIITADCP